MVQMRRRGFDPNLMRESIRGPGLDTRAWGQMARVDDDPDAIVWDAQLGWLCDVTFVGGEYDGDGPVLARVPSGGQGDGIGEHRPPRPTGLVATTIPTADPNDIVTIIGQLHSEDDTTPALAPTTINGAVIVESEAAEGQVAAIKTHMSIFPDEDLDQEWRNVRVTVAADGGVMLLADPDAEEPFVRGNDLETALGDLADAISQFAQDLAASTPAPPNSALTVADAIAASAPLISAAEALKAAAEQYLSERIFGD